ncbi:hypothetical protein BAA13334_I00781 [Brucella abortus A13334]|nr:hypothetical protein BAA13334_I00781 [Brucella abortus A13334]
MLYMEYQRPESDCTYLHTPNPVQFQVFAGQQHNRVQK